MKKIKNLINKITASRHFLPILDITIVWCSALCSILSFVNHNTDIGFTWAVTAFLNSIMLYFNLGDPS